MGRGGGGGGAGQDLLGPAFDMAEADKLYDFTCHYLSVCTCAYVEMFHFI